MIFDVAMETSYLHACMAKNRNFLHISLILPVFEKDCTSRTSVHSLHVQASVDAKFDGSHNLKQLDKMDLFAVIKI